MLALLKKLVIIKYNIKAARFINNFKLYTYLKKVASLKGEIIINYLK